MTADGLRFVFWFAAEGDYRGRIDLYLVLCPCPLSIAFFAFRKSICFFCFSSSSLLSVCFRFAYCSAHQFPPDQVQHPGIDGHTSGRSRFFDLVLRRRLFFASHDNDTFLIFNLPFVAPVHLLIVHVFTFFQSYYYTITEKSCTRQKCTKIHVHDCAVCLLILSCT